MPEAQHESCTMKQRVTPESGAALTETTTHYAPTAGGSLAAEDLKRLGALA